MSKLYILRISLTNHFMLLAPPIAPRNFTASRRVSSTILLFWVPLTLSEAQGFVTSYTVAYRQMTAGSSRTRQLGEGQVRAIRDNGTIVTGLQEDATYLVQVWANTAAGAGQRSRTVTIQPPTSLIVPTITAVIIGSIIALAAVISAVVMIIVVARGHQRKKV